MKIETIKEIAKNIVVISILLSFSYFTNVHATEIVHFINDIF